jgi:hypothetical protein
VKKLVVQAERVDTRVLHHVQQALPQHPCRHSRQAVTRVTPRHTAPHPPTSRPPALSPPLTWFIQEEQGGPQHQLHANTHTLALPTADAALLRTTHLGGRGGGRVCVDGGEGGRILMRDAGYKAW